MSYHTIILLLCLQGVPEDLLFFYQSLRHGGGLFRVDQCLLIYRYHEKAATHSVTESVQPSFLFSCIHTHILGHGVDPPPTHSCPLASQIFSELTHRYTHTHTQTRVLVSLSLWNFSHFPSVWIRNFYAFSSLCGMLSICPVVLGGNRIALWTEMFDILRSVVCARVHACVWARVHSCCCLCISMQSLQVCGSVSKSKTHQRKRSFLPSLHSHCLTFHPFFPVIPPSFPLSFLSPLRLTSARISARVDALLHQASSSVFIYHLFLEIYFKLAAFHSPLLLITPSHVLPTYFLSLVKWNHYLIFVYLRRSCSCM